MTALYFYDIIKANILRTLQVKTSMFKE